MTIKLEIAKTEDATAIASLRCAVAEDLTARYGKGPWSSSGTDKGVLYAMKISSVYVARRRDKLVASLTLGTRKPWAIDRKYFSTCARPIYLTSMAVSPDLQRQGVGRLCMAEAVKLAKPWPGDAIFLDAYDAAAGAGEFYRKCGFREVGRTVYRKVPLVYFEMLI